MKRSEQRLACNMIMSNTTMNHINLVFDLCFVLCYTQSYGATPFDAVVHQHKNLQTASRDLVHPFVSVAAVKHSTMLHGRKSRLGLPAFSRFLIKLIWSVTLLADLVRASGNVFINVNFVLKGLNVQSKEFYEPHTGFVQDKVDSRTYEWIKDHGDTFDENKKQLETGSSAPENIRLGKAFGWRYQQSMDRDTLTHLSDKKYASGTWVGKQSVWEIEVENGKYDVTFGLGAAFHNRKTCYTSKSQCSVKPSTTESSFTNVLVEGYQLPIQALTWDKTGFFVKRTISGVPVLDGRLTVSSTDNLNLTRLCFLRISKGFQPLENLDDGRKESLSGWQKTISVFKTTESFTSVDAQTHGAAIVTSSGRKMDKLNNYNLAYNAPVYAGSSCQLPPAVDAENNQIDCTCDGCPYCPLQDSSELSCQCNSICNSTHYGWWGGWHIDYFKCTDPSLVPDQTTASKYCNVKKASKVYDLLERQHNYIRIQLRYLAYRYWGTDQKAKLEVDGETVWSMEVSPSSRCKLREASLSGFVPYGFGYDDGRTVCMHDIDVILPHNEDTLGVSIYSDISGELASGGWGFDDLVISTYNPPPSLSSSPRINMLGASDVMLVSFADNNQIQVDGADLGDPKNVGETVSLSGKSTGAVVEAQGSFDMRPIGEGIPWIPKLHPSTRTSVPVPSKGDGLRVKTMCAGSGGNDLVQSGYTFFDLDTFEEPRDDWHATYASAPTRKCNDGLHPPFSGDCSLHIESGGAAAFEPTKREPDQGYYFSTAKIPYICMAYKIPPDTVINWIIWFAGVGWRNIVMKHDAWPSSFSSSKWYRGVVADFNDPTPIIPDNEWHHTCMNLDEQLTKNGHPPEESKRRAYYLRMESDPYGARLLKGESYIDEFAISDKPIPFDYYKPPTVVPTPAYHVKVQVDDSPLLEINMPKEEEFGSKGIAWDKIGSICVASGIQKRSEGDNGWDAWLNAPPSGLGCSLDMPDNKWLLWVMAATHDQTGAALLVQNRYARFDPDRMSTRHTVFISGENWVPGACPWISYSQIVYSVAYPGKQNNLEMLRGFYQPLEHPTNPSRFTWQYGLQRAHYVKEPSGICNIQGAFFQLTNDNGGYMGRQYEENWGFCDMNKLPANSGCQPAGARSFIFPKRSFYSFITLQSDGILRAAEYADPIWYQIHYSGMVYDPTGGSPFPPNSYAYGFSDSTTRSIKYVNPRRKIYIKVATSGDQCTVQVKYSDEGLYSNDILSDQSLSNWYWRTRYVYGIQTVVIDHRTGKLATHDEAKGNPCNVRDSDTTTTSIPLSWKNKEIIYNDRTTRGSKTHTFIDQCVKDDDIVIVCARGDEKVNKINAMKTIVDKLQSHQKSGGHSTARGTLAFIGRKGARREEWEQYIMANSPQTSVTIEKKIDLSFKNTETYQRPGYTIYGKMCVLCGRVYANSSLPWYDETDLQNIANGRILTLPPACRPPRRLVYNLKCSNSKYPCRIDILSNGYVKYVHTIGTQPWTDLSMSGYVSLDGVAFSTGKKQLKRPNIGSSGPTFSTEDHFIQPTLRSHGEVEGITGPSGSPYSGFKTSEGSGLSLVRNARLMWSGATELTDFVHGAYTGDQWTLDAWIRLPLASGTSAYHTLISSTIESETERHVVVRRVDFALGLHASHASVGADGQKCAQTGFMDSGIKLTDASLFPLHKWVRIFVVGAYGTQYFYVSGVLQGQVKCQAMGAIMYIGNRPSGQSGSWSESWGDVSKLLLYNRALSSAQIAVAVVKEMENYGSCDAGCSGKQCATATLTTGCTKQLCYGKTVWLMDSSKWEVKESFVALKNSKMYSSESENLNPLETSRSYSSRWNDDPIGLRHAQSTLDSPQAWSAKANDLNQWVELDLGATMEVVGVITQGRRDYDQYVKTYKVDTSIDRIEYTPVDFNVDEANPNTERIFDGNVDRSTKVTNLFEVPVPGARYVRVHPVAWYRHISMRVGVVVRKTSKDIRHGVLSHSSGSIVEWSALVPENVRSPRSIKIVVGNMKQENDPELVLGKERVDFIGGKKYQLSMWIRYVQGGSSGPPCTCSPTSKYGFAFDGSNPIDCEFHAALTVPNAWAHVSSQWTATATQTGNVYFHFGSCNAGTTFYVNEMKLEVESDTIFGPSIGLQPKLAVDFPTQWTSEIITLSRQFESTSKETGEPKSGVVSVVGSANILVGIETFKSVGSTECTFNTLSLPTPAHRVVGPILSEVYVSPVESGITTLKAYTELSRTSKTHVMFREHVYCKKTEAVTTATTLQECAVSCMQNIACTYFSFSTLLECYLEIGINENCFPTGFVEDLSFHVYKIASVGVPYYEVQVNFGMSAVIPLPDGAEKSARTILIEGNKLITAAAFNMMPKEEEDPRQFCDSQAYPLFPISLFAGRFLLPRQLTTFALNTLDANPACGSTTSGRSCNVFLRPEELGLNNLPTGATLVLYNLMHDDAVDQFELIRVTEHGVPLTRGNATMTDVLRTTITMFAIDLPGLLPPPSLHLSNRTGGMIQVHWKYNEPGYYEKVYDQIRFFELEMDVQTEKTFASPYKASASVYVNSSTLDFKKNRLHETTQHRFRIRTITGSKSACTTGGDLGCHEGPFSKYLYINTTTPTPPSKINQPTFVKSTGGAVFIAWDEPWDFGGVPLQNYIIRSVGDMTRKTIVPVDSLVNAGVGLKPYSLYKLSVAARNTAAWCADVGDGPFSLEIEANTTHYTKADKIKGIVSVTGETGGAFTLRWQKPFDQGGVNATYYVLKRILVDWNSDAKVAVWICAMPDKYGQLSVLELGSKLGVLKELASISTALVTWKNDIEESTDIIIGMDQFASGYLELKNSKTCVKTTINGLSSTLFGVNNVISVLARVRILKSVELEHKMPILSIYDFLDSSKFSLQLSLMRDTSSGAFYFQFVAQNTVTIVVETNHLHSLDGWINVGGMLFQEENSHKYCLEIRLEGNLFSKVCEDIVLSGAIPVDSFQTRNADVIVGMANPENNGDSRKFWTGDIADVRIFLANVGNKMREVVSNFADSTKKITFSNLRSTKVSHTVTRVLSSRRYLHYTAALSLVDIPNQECSLQKNSSIALTPDVAWSESFVIDLWAKLDPVLFLNPASLLMLQDIANSNNFEVWVDDIESTKSEGNRIVLSRDDLCCSWVHIAMQIIPGNNATIFINGYSIHSTKITTAAFEKMWVGRTASVGSVIGRIDEIRLFKGSFGVLEIRKMMTISQIDNGFSRLSTVFAVESFDAGESAGHKNNSSEAFSFEKDNVVIKPSLRNTPAFTGLIMHELLKTSNTLEKNSVPRVLSSSSGKAPQILKEENMYFVDMQGVNIDWGGVSSIGPTLRSGLSNAQISSGVYVVNKRNGKEFVIGGAFSSAIDGCNFDFSTSDNNLDFSSSSYSFLQNALLCWDFNGWSTREKGGVQTDAAGKSYLWLDEGYMEYTSSDIVFDNGAEYMFQIHFGSGVDSGELSGYNITIVALDANSEVEKVLISEVSPHVTQYSAHRSFLIESGSFPVAHGHKVFFRLGHFRGLSRTYYSAIKLWTRTKDKIPFHVPDGEHYNVHIKAANYVGNSSLSDLVGTIQGSPRGPSPPYGLRIQANYRIPFESGTFVKILWSKPENEGDYPLSNYSIVARCVTREAYSTQLTAPGDVTTHQFFLQSNQTFEISIIVYTDGGSEVSESLSLTTSTQCIADLIGKDCDFSNDGKEVAIFPSQRRRLSGVDGLGAFLRNENSTVTYLKPNTAPEAHYELCSFYVHRNLKLLSGDAEFTRISCSNRTSSTESSMFEISGVNVVVLIRGVTLDKGAQVGGRMISVNGGAEAYLINVNVVGGNISTQNGGGILVSENAHIFLSGVVLRRSFTTFGAGGGLYCAGTCRLWNSRIENTFSYSSGGGIDCPGTCNIESSTIENSHVSQVNAKGGGINCMGKCTMSSVLIKYGKSVSGFGGCLHCGGSSVCVANYSMYESCHAKHGGGVAISDAANLVMSDTVIQFNAAMEGGGVWKDTNAIMEIQAQPTEEKIKSFAGAENIAVGSRGMGVRVVQNMALYGAGIFLGRVGIKVPLKECGSPRGDFCLHVIGNVAVDIISWDKGAHLPEGRGYPRFLGNYELWLLKNHLPQFVYHVSTASHGEFTGGIGGGVLSLGGDIVNVNIRNNIGNFGGGIALASHADTVPLVQNCEVENNVASANGGGIVIANSRGTKVALDRCQMSMNDAKVGGGIMFFSEESNLGLTEDLFPQLQTGYSWRKIPSSNRTFENEEFLISNSTIEKNKASIAGAGAAFANVNVTLSGRTVIAGNVALNGFGGGVWAISSKMRFSDECLIENNVAQIGGGFYFTNCSLTPTAKQPWSRIMITSNIATQNGAGIYAADFFEVKHANIEHSNAASGGGLYVSTTSSQTNAEANMENIKLTSNKASMSGGGCYVNNFKGTVAFLNSKVELNIAQDDGGGLNVLESTFFILNEVEVNSNSVAKGSGGGIKLYKVENVSIYKSQIMNNDSPMDGGGMQIENDCAVRIETTIIAHCTSHLGSGAGIAASKSEVYATDLQCLRNVAKTGNGGCLSLSQDSSVQLTDSFISGVSDQTNAENVNENSTTILPDESSDSNEGRSMDMTCDTWSALSKYDALNGGGVYVDYSTFVSRNVTVAGVIAKKSGGAIYLSQSQVEFERTHITNFKACSGGALYMVQSKLNITSTSITNGISMEDGGGMFASKSSSIVQTETRFTGCKSLRGSGGAVSVSDSMFHADRFQAEKSEAYHGGCVFSNKGRVYLNSANFSACKAQYSYGGGILLIRGSLLRANQLRVYESAASQYGGGVFCSDSACTFMNSELTANTAMSGGAALCAVDATQLFLHNVLINSNVVSSHTGRGAGIYIPPKNAIMIENFIQNINVQRMDKSSVLVASDLTIRNNFIYGAGSEGGGWYIGTGTVRASCISFTSNEAGNGGMAYISEAHVLINCSKADNLVSESVAQKNGGGFFLDKYAIVEVSNFVVRNSFAKDSGGFVYMQSGSELYMRNCHVDDSKADGDGGAFALANSRTVLELSSSTVSNSTSGKNSNGGVFLVTDGAELITHWVNITNNYDGTEASTVHASHGGCIAAMSFSKMRLSHTIVKDCGTKDGKGGGIFVGKGTNLLMQNSHMSNCYANSGGALNLEEGEHTIQNSVISKNYAEYEGGAIFAAENANLLILGSLFSNNFAPEGDGGSIFMDIASNLKASNSVFSSNLAVRGGAIFFSRSTRGNFSTTHFKHNTADENGGGVSVEDNYGDRFQFFNSSFSFNSANIYGGGLSFTRAMAAVSSCTFANNAAALGGALAMVGQTRKQPVTLHIFKTKFLANKANNSRIGRGGGLYVAGNTKLKIKECTEIKENVALQGGALFATDTSQIDIDDTAWSLNSAQNSVSRQNDDGVTGSGGALYLDKSTKVSVRIGVFDSNIAYWRGGGIYVSKDACDLTFLSGLFFFRNGAFHDALINGEKHQESGVGGGIFWDYSGQNELILNRNLSFDKNYPYNISTPPVSVEFNQGFPELIMEDANHVELVKSGIAIKNSKNKLISPRLILKDKYGNHARLDKLPSHLDKLGTRCRVRQSAIPINPTRTISAFQGYVQFDNLHGLGYPGERGNISFLCTPGPYECEGQNTSVSCLSSVQARVEIKPCDPGEELNGQRICTRCNEGRYSPEGVKCFECPVGGQCRTSAYKLGFTKDKNVYVGNVEPDVLPGYWQSKIARTIGRIVPQGRGFCDWDPTYCRDDPVARVTWPECRHGLCEFVDGRCLPSRIERYDSTRIYNCLQRKQIHACPLDETSCKGTIDQSGPNSSVCHTGYGGVKCDVCKRGYYKLGDRTCAKCAGNLEESVAVYTAGALAASSLFLFLLYVYLREDTGKGLVKCCFKTKRTKVKPESDLDDDETVSKLMVSHVELHPEKFKIILSFLQIFSQMKFNYGIKWPSAVAYYMRTFASLDFDLLAIAAVDCIYETNYYFSLLFATLMPFAAALFLFFVKLYGRQIYVMKLNRIPRKCVKSGKFVKHIMNLKEYNSKRLHMTKEALIDAGMKEPSLKALKDELAETAPHLPPMSSIWKGYEDKPSLQGSDLQDVLKHNVFHFRKRCVIRINHLFYDVKLYKLFFVMLLVLYPSVSVRIIRYFKCEEIGDVWILTKDNKTPCFDATYATYGGVAIFGVFFFVLGVPALFFYLLWTARNNNVNHSIEMMHINKLRLFRCLEEAKADAALHFEYYEEPLTDKEKYMSVQRHLRRMNFRSHSVYNKLGFIYYAYNEHFWWYESVELARKLCLNGLVTLILPGEAGQIVFGIVVCLMFLFCVTTFHPYKSFLDNFLAIMAHVQLLLTLFCGLLLTLNVDFIGSKTIRNPLARQSFQTDIVQYTVIASHASLMLFFVVAVVIEATCSKDHEQQKRRHEIAQFKIKQMGAQKALEFARENDTEADRAFIKRMQIAEEKAKKTDVDDLLDGFHGMLMLNVDDIGATDETSDPLYNNCKKATDNFKNILQESVDEFSKTEKLLKKFESEIAKKAQKLATIKDIEETPDSEGDADDVMKRAREVAYMESLMKEFEFLSQREIKRYQCMQIVRMSFNGSGKELMDKLVPLLSKTADNATKTANLEEINKRTSLYKLDRIIAQIKALSESCDDWVNDSSGRLRELEVEEEGLGKEQGDFSPGSVNDPLVVKRTQLMTKRARKYVERAAQMQVSIHALVNKLNETKESVLLDGTSKGITNIVESTTEFVDNEVDAWEAALGNELKDFTNFELEEDKKRQQLFLHLDEKKFKRLMSTHLSEATIDLDNDGNEGVRKPRQKKKLKRSDTVML